MNKDEYYINFKQVIFTPWQNVICRTTAPESPFGRFYTSQLYMQTMGDVFSLSDRSRAILPGTN